MLFAFFMVCVVELGVSLLLLVLLGRRLRFSSRVVGLVLAGAVAYGAGRFAAQAWSLSSSPRLAAEMFVFGISLVVVVARPVWNPVGQVFFGGYIAAACAYLVFAAGITVAGGLSFVASVASAFLFVLEAMALAITATFAFETCDILCRTRHSRVFPEPDPAYRPFVSLQIPSYNEPPDMLIETIKAAEAIDYPSFEIVVMDNNTDDPDVWQPVEEYCRSRPNVTFAHVDALDGYKSGALNLALRELTDDRAEVIGVLDSDYLVQLSARDDRLLRRSEDRVRADATGLSRVAGQPVLHRVLRRVSLLLLDVDAVTERARLDHLRGDDGPAAARSARVGRRLGRVGDHRGRGCVAADAARGLVGPLPGEELRPGNHAAHVRGAEEPALPVVLRRHADPAQALAVADAVGLVAGQPSVRRAAARLPRQRPAVAERPRVFVLHRRPARHRRHPPLRLASSCAPVRRAHRALAGDAARERSHPCDLGLEAAGAHQLPPRAARLHELALPVVHRCPRLRRGARARRGHFPAHAEDGSGAPRPCRDRCRTLGDAGVDRAARARRRPPRIRPHERVRLRARLLAGVGVLLVAVDVVAQPTRRAHAGARASPPNGGAARTACARCPRLSLGSAVLAGGAAALFVVTLVFGAAHPGHPSNPLRLPRSSPPTGPHHGVKGTSTTKTSTTATTTAPTTTTAPATTSTAATTTTATTTASTTTASTGTTTTGP